MRFFYCDSGLTNDRGHHANSCRAIAGEMRRRGVETQVLACVDVDAKLQRELGAKPCFLASTYWLSDGDPICGWLSAFLFAWRKTADDFRRLDAEIGADDLVFVNSAMPAQLLGLISWMTSSAKPFRAVVEFGSDPGLDVTFTETGLNVEVRDPRIDARGTLYAYAGQQISESLLRRLAMATFDPESSATYSKLLLRPVRTLPVPRGRVTAARSRAGSPPLTVAVLGHQRPEKGYSLVPEIFAELSRLFPPEAVRFLAHHCTADSMRDAHEALKQLDRCSVDERLADEGTWKELLDRSDLILCPYEPGRFAVSYSAIACEAIANGIPFIGPAGTTLERISREFQSGIAFREWTVESIVQTVAKAVGDFDALAAKAAAGAEKWGRLHGPARCVDAILA